MEKQISEALAKFEALIREQLARNEKIKAQKEFVDFGTTVNMEKTRAVIKVQDGCDRFCSYCIIPYARGKVRSKKPEIVIREIKNLIDDGHKEIVLTGIHTGSYYDSNNFMSFDDIYDVSGGYTPNRGDAFDFGSLDLSM